MTTSNTIPETLKGLAPKLAVAIQVRETAGRRRTAEPTNVSVPFACGELKDTSRLRLRDELDRPTAFQSHVLSYWHDDSVQWLNLQFPASVDAHCSTAYKLDLNGPPAVSSQEMSARDTRQGLLIQTGDYCVQLNRDSDVLFSLHSRDERNELGTCRLTGHDHKSRSYAPRIQRVSIEQIGAVSARVLLHGSCGKHTKLRFTALIEFFHSSEFRVQITAENPSRAKHAGGYWDLGDPGSALVRELGLEFADIRLETGQVDWLEQPDGDLKTTEGFVEIYQESSGGRNWNSRNHVNRDNSVPMQFRGYRVKTIEGRQEGLRATPVVCLNHRRASIGCAPVEFWEKFPTAVTAERDTIRVGLLPQQHPDLHELQAGEHCSRTVWFGLGTDVKSLANRLADRHRPLQVRCDPEQYSRSRAIPFLTSSDHSPRAEACELLSEALTGPDSFFEKRETIDEYGWRNFGDVWADHEAAYYAGQQPIISHFNNQYDLLHGFLIQWLLTGDQRWWRLAQPLAQHVMDIDIYHTNRDKAAYSGGLFWHTDHYHDAATSTHRCKSRRMRRADRPTVGGGPGAEHNYASGLLLYYYLTGCSKARDCVLELARWVIAMDDGKRHVLGLLSPTATGYATTTGGGGLQDLGRAAGNSIRTLLEAWLASNDTEYLEQAERFIRRTIHPDDDIPARQLNNAEDRWSYTVYLQTLALYLHLMERSQRFGSTYEYARSSLLNYTRWMVRHEGRYLDQPEQLEFPTETWPAQELRKGTVLLLAAAYANDEAERAGVVKRARQILDRAWRDLMSFESRHYTRPLAIVLQQGFIESGFCADPRYDQPGTSNASEFPSQDEFVNQKAELRDTIRRPWRLLAALPHLVHPPAWQNTLTRSWAAECLRQATQSVFPSHR